MIPSTPHVSHKPLCIEFEDCDAMGVVYHPNYLRFVERARVEYLRVHGIPYSKFLDAGCGLVIAEVHANYWRPARFEDHLHIYSRQVGFAPKKIILEQFITKNILPLDQLTRPIERLPGRIFSARLHLVAVNLSTVRSQPLPESIASVLAKLTMTPA